ncbi:efflux RND transporter permease subunit [Pseudoalteromonas sp. SR44-5]|uniref:efflux RND transporter permease subunit n=1 Tax=Pseudoalteromonas TaxID=53246 RepID=UPI001600E9A8|nr:MULTISPECIES: efflux RND transporter permease subunit [unclassified Pseudoalteromonas]MBB1332430.1 efflux RND transporter permease subunit [Pseudoalteromonas sp. SR41-6]MBB1342450.1 efflux RND transporter permease subunit [Pseudoalteromonas sp. SR45-6]MBB1368017.1 efflux RND transporter permease subunit [Pseudoalteromonas sp. SR44-5]MBB1457690.1 efflux RND transporter permease subunit [Pseudoalteromonas sp. SG41-8]MBB1481458.1 efflux RND transporter permease subunit [Pseudoalteromonas sp. S
MKQQPMMQDLPSMAIRRPVLIVVLNLLIIIAGIAAIAGVEVRELPDVDTPRITVSASFPGGSPETVDTEVTSKLEGAVARVSGVKTIRAQSEEGNARIVVEFRAGVDLDDAANETRESVARVQRELPEEVERVSIIKADNDAEAVVSLTVSSDTIALEALTELVEVDLAPQFLTIPGVADVRLNGDRKRVLRVRLDPLKLTSFNLTVPDVAQVLRQAPFDVPAGSLKSTDQQIIVRADATSITAEQVADIIIRDGTRIGDIAAVYFGPADPRSMVRLNGQPVIGMEVIRQAQSNTIEISDEVLSLLAKMQTRFPELKFTLTSDDAQFIRSSVDEVIYSLVLTVLLVIITLWVFIGSWRATLVPAFAIPVALVGSLALIWALGFSINILTLLALVLATGLIVDDAIVVSENIQRQRGLGLGRRAAAVIGTREVFFAVVATTAVLAAVFVPIAFLPSTAGRLFREFGGVLAGAVIISSFVALSLVPALTSKLKLKQGGKHPFAKIGHWLANIYTKTIHWVLDHAWLTFIASILVAAGSGALYLNLDNELLPSEDRGKIRIFARGPDGVGLNFMDRQAMQMEDILLPYVQSGEIESIYTVVGQWDPNIVFITVPLKHWDERHFSQQEIINKIRGPLGNIPGAAGYPSGSNSLNLRGQGGGIELALLGQDYLQIYKAAQDFAAQVEQTIPSIDNVRISYQPSQPQLRVNIDRRRAEELGVSLSDISITLRAAINGDDIADLNIGDQSVPIILQAQNQTIKDPSDLANLYISANNGQLVPLSSVATITEEGVAAELERHAQRRAIELDMELPADMSIAQLVSQLRDISEQTLPSGISLAFKGEALTFEETSNEVFITYILAFLIVFLVLAAQFENVNSAVVVMVTVPFGITSAILALYLTGTSLNIYSQIGLVMLIGLIAKNAILLVEFADQLRDQGLTVRKAVEQAALVRLRPITMTLISTLLGALPLILSTGAGAEARNAIGWVVFGGLSLAVLFTLYLTPVIYLGLARFTTPRGDESKQLAQELDKVE